MKPAASGNALHGKSAAFDSNTAAFGGGALIGSLGGLIGLGGAKFCLPLLIGVFQFAALGAVFLNKAMRLVVVVTALPFRAFTVSWGEIAAHWSRHRQSVGGKSAGGLVRSRLGNPSALGN